MFKFVLASVFSVFAVQAENFYDTLGVAPGASPSDVKKAFHKIAREEHPDKVQQKLLNKYNMEKSVNELPEEDKQEITAAKEKFQKAREAFETLQDDDKRKAYDASFESDSNVPEYNEEARFPEYSYEEARFPEYNEEEPSFEYDIFADHFDGGDFSENVQASEPVFVQVPADDFQNQAKNDILLAVIVQSMFDAFYAPLFMNLFENVVNHYQVSRGPDSACQTFFVC